MTVFEAECKLKSYPSEQFVRQLSAVQRERLSNIVAEVQLLSQCYNFFPEHISDADWKRLLQCETLKQRFIHIKFCRQNEKKELKCEMKRQQKACSKLKRPTATPGLAMFVSKNQLKHISEQRRFMNHLHNLEMDLTPKLLVDCRFLNALSPQALSQTLCQLVYLASENRDRRRSWPLLFCNFDTKDECILEAKNRYLEMVNSSSNFSLTVSPSSYLNFHPPERIVYLSPHAESDLEEVDGSKAYVLGAIVDRVAQYRLHPQATLLAAQQDHVEVRRLPLDKFIKWKSGSKSLTLLAVTSILYSVFESGGDWETALKKYIPVRHVRGPEEKNAFGRVLHSRIHDYETRLLMELGKRLQFMTSTAASQRYTSCRKPEIVQ